MILSRTLQMDGIEMASDTLKREVLPVLKNDGVAQVVKYDELIIAYGNKLCIKYRAHKHHQYMIRQRMRQAARFLLKIKEIRDDVHDLAACFHPKYVDDSIAAINKMANISDNADTYSAPTTATTVGTLLKDIGDTLKIQCMKKDEEERIKQIDRFLILLVDELKIKVNRTALEDQKDRTRKKKVILPSKSDIQLLHKYLTVNRRKMFQSLKKEFSFDCWKKLAGFVLISVQLFNRRRAGELERVRICDFESYQTLSAENNDFFLTLNQESKQTAEQYVRFEIRGKLGRGVPVLLHTDIVKCIELILHHRSRAGVDVKNPFVFGIPNRSDSYHYLRATELLRKFAVECGAEKPTTLRGTALRKHFATTCVALELTDSEVSDVANFMGHHEKIHHKHYRLSIPANDILNMSKLLEKVMGNDPNESEESENEENDDPQTKNMSKSGEFDPFENEGEDHTNNATPPFAKAEHVRNKGKAIADR
ncbi:uncharacterized protein LOC116163696 [Photinus pyralis]|uniref:uncharacterized protein LOC116163696 n=1 Tax=Photinus pyralis TaxID=7054 RepID=UPI00126722AB|nr:uncharacterized protein LOC116163696 [Photinus pyralis]